MVSGPHLDADLWGDGDEEEGQGGGGGGADLEREWRARREEHWAGGYREGLEAGKHETVQEGFDEGYKLGAAAGFECGVARGAAATLRALAPRLPAEAQQPSEEQRQEQQPGIGAMPYQQLARQVCEALMAAPAQPPGQAPPLPPAVRAALDRDVAALQRRGLHVGRAPEAGHREEV